MPVVFDASFLVPLLDKRAAVDASIRRRLAKLTGELQATRDRILIPTPALAEFLTKVDDPVVYLMACIEPATSRSCRSTSAPRLNWRRVKP